MQVECATFIYTGQKGDAAGFIMAITQLEIVCVLLEYRIARIILRFTEKKVKTG